MILHCMKKETWQERKNKQFWGKRNIEAEGFIHCSTVEYFWRVAPNFKEINEELLLLCIDESKLKSEVRYEDGDNCGRFYPHVYGLINNDAVILHYAAIKVDRDGERDHRNQKKHAKRLRSETMMYEMRYWI